MSKKIILLALAAASVAAFALPATAMAEDVPLHLVPKPEGAKTFDGEGGVTWTTSSGSFGGTSLSGTVSFASSTTGTIQLVIKGVTEPFGGKCTTPGQPEGTIVTKVLELHLLTVEDSVTHATGPGLLLTPNGGVFVEFKCPFVGLTIVTGNGLIGTITKPECGRESSEATIQFSSSSTGVQTHKTVVGTTEEYSLKIGTMNASLDASGIITLGTQTKLECT